MDSGYQPVESQRKGIIAAITKGKRYALILKVLCVLLVMYTITLFLPISASSFSMPSKPSPTNIDSNFPPPSSSLDETSHLGQGPDSMSKPDTRNVAAIIETRPLEMLSPLMLHFSAVLGPNWPIHLFTATTEHLKSSAMQRAINAKTVVIHILPSNYSFDDRDSVSDFLTQPWFYEELAPASHVLLFQTDSIICANAPLHVDDFLQYDFTGAPIAPEFETAAGYNGGLSLRNRQMMLDIVNTHSWRSEQDRAKDPQDSTVRYEMRYEDQWFYQKMIDMPKDPDGKPYANLADKEEAKKFSVETYWYDRPIGYHQVGRWGVWNEERKKMVETYCPEWNLATKLEVKD